jgi:hypothetical protein
LKNLLQHWQAGDDVVERHESFNVEGLRLSENVNPNRSIYEGSTWLASTARRPLFPQLSEITAPEA